MDITTANFKERLPEIENAIETATFMSIDGEFTGLNVLRGVSSLDTPAERYVKIKESARQFLLVQFGLCTFHYDQKTDGYKYSCYNFYVWPRPASRNAPDPRFMCQTSSIDFLINQRFDFNKLFRDGVSYMRPCELDKLKNSLEERQQVRRRSLIGGESNLSTDIVVPEDQQDFLAGVKLQLEELVASDEQQLDLEKCNSFQRRLIYQTARQHFQHLSLASVQNQKGDRIIRVVKADKEEQERLAGLRDEAEVSDLEEALGFSRVIAKISSSGKLVLGHNMILDLGHTISQFCGTLPDSYLDFKAMANSFFPKILDTKLMASTSPFKQEILNSSLEELYKAVQLSPYKLPSVKPVTPELGYQEDDEKYHEAAYDAYITGLCFIAMSNRFGQLMRAADKKGSEGVRKCVLPDSEILEPFYNKLHLMKSDIPYMNLGAEDIVPDRSHVFHLTFPSEWKTADIIHVFAPFCHVFVSWIDDTSAFVSLKEKDWANQILPTLQTKAAETYRIQTYQDFLKSKEASSCFASQNCGITPTLEKFPFNPLGSNVDTSQTNKRAANTDHRSIKRLKSVTEEEQKKKTFDEPEWD